MTDAPRAAVEALLARRREGLITDAELQLAAACGHPAAMTLLGEDAPEPPLPVWEWSHWLEQTYGNVVAYQAELAAAMWVLPHWQRAFPCDDCYGDAPDVEDCETCQGSGSSDPRPAAFISEVELTPGCEICRDPRRRHECRSHGDAMFSLMMRVSGPRRAGEAAAFDEALFDLLTEHLQGAPRVDREGLEAGGVFEEGERLFVKTRRLLQAMRKGLGEFLYLPRSQAHCDISDERLHAHRVAEVASRLGASETTLALSGGELACLELPRSAALVEAPPPLYAPAMWAAKAIEAMATGALGGWCLYAAARSTGEGRRSSHPDRPPVEGQELREVVGRALAPSVFEL